MNRPQVRQLLNSLFLIGFAIALILYLSEQRTAFLIVSFTSIAIKLAEYVLRFMR